MATDTRTKSDPKPSKAHEAAEKPAEDELTAIGKRTLAGFKQRYGEEEGEAKFQAAMDNGTIDRAKMEKEPDKEPADTDSVTGRKTKG